MKKLRVLICDTGISDWQSELVKTIDIGKGWLDENGHGTQIVELNSDVIKEVDMYSIKVLDKHRTCEFEELINAIDTAKSMELDVLCLALALDIEEIPIKEEQRLRTIITELCNQGTIVFASYHNKINNSYPACLPNVIGIRMNQNIDDGIICTEITNKDFQIGCTPIICKSFDNRYTLFSGNSMATALFMRCFIQTYNNYMSYENLAKTIDNMLRNEFDFRAIITNYNPDNLRDKIKLARIKNIIGLVLTKLDLQSSDILAGLSNSSELNLFLKLIEQNGFEINNNLFLSIVDIVEVRSLANYLYQNEEDDKCLIRCT